MSTLSTTRARGVCFQADAAGSSSPSPGWLGDFHCRYENTLRRVIRRSLHNEHDVQDAYQDCLLRLAQRFPREAPEGIDRYAARAARNLAVDHLRRRMRRTNHDEQFARWFAQQCGHRTAPELPETSPQIGQAIVALPERLRQVVVLRDLHGLSYKRIGALLNICPRSARVYRRQALIRLRKRPPAAMEAATHGWSG